MDVNKIVSFKNGLNNVIRSRLQNQLNLPTIYLKYLRTIQQLISKIATPLYVQVPKIAYPHDLIDLNELDKLIISALTTTPLSNPPNHFILPPIPARLIILELRDKYRQNDKYIRYSLKDYWIRNYFLTLYITLVRTIFSKQVIVVAVNDKDYNDYNDSDDENGSGFGVAVNKIMVNRLELDWRRYVRTSAQKQAVFLRICLYTLFIFSFIIFNARGELFFEKEIM